MSFQQAYLSGYIFPINTFEYQSASGNLTINTTNEGAQLSLDSNGGSVVINSQTDTSILPRGVLYIESTGDANIQSDNGNIQLTSVGNLINLESFQDLNIRSDTGNINLNANGTTEQQIILSAGSGQPGTLLLSEQNVQLIAPAAGSQMAISVNGNMNIETQGEQNNIYIATTDTSSTVKLVGGLVGGNLIIAQNYITLQNYQPTGAIYIESYADLTNQSASGNILLSAGKAVYLQGSLTDMDQGPFTSNLDLSAVSIPWNGSFLINAGCNQITLPDYGNAYYKDGQRFKIINRTGTTINLVTTSSATPIYVNVAATVYYSYTIASYSVAEIGTCSGGYYIN